MDPQDLLLTAARASLVYFYVLVVVRILGKRAVKANTAFDLLVALMLGEVVDEIIYGDVSIIQGLIAIGVVAAWHFINAWASYKSTFIDRLTGSGPDVVIKNGKFVEEALAKERMNREDVLSELRMLEVKNLKEVREAALEPSGQISVLREEWAEPLQKSDLETEAPENKGLSTAVSDQQAREKREQAKAAQAGKDGSK